MNTYKKLAKYIGPYWKDTVFTWLCVFVEAVCEVGVVFMMQFLIDEVKAITGESTQLKLIAIYSAAIALLAIIAAIAGIIAGYFAASASAGFGKNLRKAMYDRIQEYSFKNIDKFSTSSIVTRTTTDVTNVQNAFMMSIRMVIRAPFVMTFALIMCFVTQWRLAWIFLIIIPVILFLLLYISKKVHPTFVKIFDTYDALNETVEEDVDGIRIVKAFNREKVQSGKFRSVSDFIYKNFIYAEKILSFNSPIMNTAVFGAMIGISYLGARLIIETSGSEHPFTVGGLSTLITYILMIMMALMMISMVYVQIIISKNSTERIVEIIQEVPDIQSPENAVKEVKDGSVDFNDVSFCYHEGKDVLSDIDLHIKSGSMVGIIGSTGSSKTTLVSLMARLYDATKGSVLVGGVNVKDYDLKTLRDKVAVVLQKNTLFTGTIRSNLLWGKEDATEEELDKACELAQCNEFLSRFPKGLDTEIAQGGTNVSGGQKQRLCIARALLKDPKILILDDSTSACDTHTDSLIREGLQTTKKDVTKFIIAQRVLSIKDCDLILVMDKGRIIARGNNDELMQNCSVYRELYESQLGGGDFDVAE